MQQAQHKRGTVDGDEEMKSLYFSVTDDDTIRAFLKKYRFVNEIMQS